MATNLLELSNAASSILFHILETPTSLLIRGKSLSTFGSCQLHVLKQKTYLTLFNEFKNLTDFLFVFIYKIFYK